MLYKLNLPNDYGSEADSEAALAAGGYEPISDAANEAGLRYVRDSDHGAIWEGSEAQFSACVANLPVWAQPYASPVTE